MGVYRKIVVAMLIFLAPFLLSVAAFASDCAKPFSELQIAENTKQKLLLLEENVLREMEESFYETQKVAANPAKWNQKVLAALEALPVSGAERGRLNGFSQDQIETLFRLVNEHPVASMEVKSKYDPTTIIGFCFGRAMSVHLEALRAGLAKENIRKVWVVGPMRHDNIIWKHHVATMVRGTDKNWYVIDPEYTKPLLVRDWYEDLNSMSVDGRLQFFASSPSRWGPMNNRPYEKMELGHPYYNNYFNDLLKESREEARELARKNQQRILMEKETSLKDVAPLGPNGF